ncbi:ash family protein [Salmonella enterica]|nr:ash family protein [Salmonella enterica]EMD3031358.1 ash family protein [Salmonella enterica]EMD4642070.1 ash family protein [Salmonella enterica]EMD6067889.1 ash family protein [Salmonella enterica]
MMFSCGQQKMCLIKMLTGCYIFLAATLLAVGRSNPVNTQATMSALSAFFVVATIFATVRHFMAWCIRIPCVGTQTDAHIRMHHTTMSMVALAGPTSVGPGPCVTGIATPVRAIASECSNSSDSMFAIHRRLPSWLQPQPKNTQNPGSPNSATTVGARFTVRRWWLCTPVSVLLMKIQKAYLCICPTYFPTSTMILRL